MPAQPHLSGGLEPPIPIPLERLAHLALARGLQYAAALALGLLAARSMRARALHWSWGALALALIFFVRSALGGAGPPLGICALGATARGRRWHREDLQAGGDLRRIALSRPLPHVILLAALLRLSPIQRAQRWPSICRESESLALGRERSGRAVTVPFGALAGRHTLVLGATGSGKTMTQTLMATQAIERGMATIVVDPKGDRDMRERLRIAAARTGRDFMEWTPTGPSVYNPYSRGGETEIADRVLAGERFTEPHYLRQAQRYLGHVVRALRARGIEVGLHQIVRHLDPADLEVLVRELPEDRAAGTHDYLDSLTPRQLRDLAGVRDRLAILTESDVGPWLDPLTDGARRFDLIAAARTGSVVYFNLESDSRPLLAQMLGAAIVQDLQSAVSALQGCPARALVVIDEFSALAAEHVVALFGRARSAGFSLLLGTQELSDLRPPGRERLLEQVMGNLSLLIAHRQVVPSSAELIARLAGNRGTWRLSWSNDGRTTRTRASEPVLTPECLTGLAPGWAAVMALGSAERVRLAKITSTGEERQ